MGTLVQIKVYDTEANQVIKKAFDLIDDLEQKMSLNIADSEINQINQAAGKKPIKVSAATYEVIKKALDYAKLSQGAFDPTIGPLVELWGIGTDQAQVPGKEELNKRLKLVDYKQVKLYPQEKKVYLTTDKMSLDVGGIAKGYAADKVVDLLRKEGVDGAYISLGGNVSVLGTKPGDELWKIGIRDPKASDQGEVMASVELTDKTIVTSGNYERYFIEDGTRYHHILNPKTGYPARNKIISSTIVTDSSFEADALSTILYILGIQEGLNLINQLEGIEALVITKNNKVYLTSQLEDKVKIFEPQKYNVINN